MKLKHYILSAVAAVAACGATSCQDDMSNIGGSLSQGEITIWVDSIETSLDSKSVYLENYDSRNITKLLGRINVPEYGSLDCSFVSQMMCATSMNVPDTITPDLVDSLRLVLSVPVGSLTGDSLAPQQLKVYRLKKQLPADISSTFNPEGYYDESTLLGTKSYTVSNITRGDSAMKNAATVRIPVDMPLELGREIFTMYRNEDPVFQWPSTFNKFFPGIYVEQNFGNGCIANVIKSEFYTYWHYNSTKYEMQPDSTYAYVSYVKRDSVCLMAYQPEVLASNVIDFKISDYIKNLVDNGQKVITTPGGYSVETEFPVRMLIDRFRGTGSALSVVSSLQFELPAEAIANDYGLTVAPHLLMIKKSEYESFFADNKIPDGVTSFYAAYDADSESYHFNAMRSYFVKMLEKADSGETITDDDCEFMLVPVSVQTESSTNYDGSVSTYVTRCQWYIEKPTMTWLHTDKAVIKFVYSSQSLE